MDNEKRKNNIKGNRRERANKGGRPVKGATEKLKYRITVKMATEDYYLPASSSMAVSKMAERRNGSQKNIATLSVSYVVWRTT